jgi:para-nitrobenzyl esterase
MSEEMMKRSFGAAVLVLLVGGSRARGVLPEPVRIETGLLTGTAGGVPEVRVYKGIPYAAAPTGALRWREPVAPASWSGVRAADRFGAVCPQMLPPAGSFYQQEYFSGAAPKMSEDCLTVNVWTGATDPQERRPVMVWIHGGGGVQGYSSEPCFDGTALAQHGVVLVSFNYRLGILGLFAHPALSAESAHHVSGNYQELDQIAALGWVQRNIAAFGGDPHNVTVFGQSSGGASINRLLVCPLAKGLFQKVIIESAAVLNSRDSKTALPVMEARGQAFAKLLHAEGLEQMRAIPASELVTAAKAMKFDPVIDGYVLPELAADGFDGGKAYAVPMLIGSNSDEGPRMAVTAVKFRGEIEQRFAGTAASVLLGLYPAASDEEATQSRHDERRDESFAGERAEAAAQVRLHVPVYLYYFDRVPPGRDARYGAFHAAELEYVFGTFSATDRPWEAEDHDLSAALIGYWTDFARTGDPNGAGRPHWPAYDPEGEWSMELGRTLAGRVVPDRARLDLLTPLLRKEAH